MTKDQITIALERVKTWPDDRQVDAVRLLEALERAGTEAHDLSDEEIAAVEVGLAEADRGEFVSGEDMAMLWSRHRK